MAKDPAFLFYSSDFIIGTVFFTNEQIGKYVKLLCFQHQFGHLAEDAMLAVCGSHDEKIFSKFLKDDKGLYYNTRLEEEYLKRKSFCQSRRNNSSTSKAYASHMHEHMENENVNEVKNSNEDKVVFNFEILWAKYPNKDGKKAAERHFHASVKTSEDFDAINQALNNYLRSEKVLKGYIKNGSTWFNNWQDWKTYKPPDPVQSKPPADVIAVTCKAAKMTEQEAKTEIIKKGYSEYEAVQSTQRAWGKVS